MRKTFFLGTLWVFAITLAVSPVAHPISASEPIDISGDPCPPCPESPQPPPDSGSCPSGYSETSAGCVTDPRRKKYVHPRYPSRLKYKRQEGCVGLRFVIQSDGRVGQVWVVDSDDPRFEQSAIKAISKWRYKPSQLDGASVPVSVCVIVAFRP